MVVNIGPVIFFHVKSINFYLKVHVLQHLLKTKNEDFNMIETDKHEELTSVN